MALVRLDQKERRRNLISLNPLSQPKFASNTDGLASPALAPQESPALLSEESKDKMNKASFTRIKPKGEEELRLLLEQQLAEERRVEEDDLKQTAAEEERIKSEIDREEEMKDLMQEGGPNPRIHPDSIRYNFTTGRRPRGMTTRGDLAYQSEGDASYLKVYKGSMLFLPLQFSPNGSGKKLNQYTVTMEIQLLEPAPSAAASSSSAVASSPVLGSASLSPSLRGLDERGIFDRRTTSGVPAAASASAPSTSKIALLQTARYNEDAAEIYMQNGLVGRQILMVSLNHTHARSGLGDLANANKRADRICR